MEDECVSNLEQTVAKLQADRVEIFAKLDELTTAMKFLITTQTPPIIMQPEVALTALAVDNSRGRTARPAVPPDFDGDDEHRVILLLSCHFLRICGLAYRPCQRRLTLEQLIPAINTDGSTRLMYHTPRTCVD